MEDFERCLERARTLKAVFHAEPQYPDDWFKSFTLRDPDGYYIGIYSMQDIAALETKAKESLN